MNEFVCGICSRPFASASGLASHTRAHARRGEYPEGVQLVVTWDKPGEVVEPEPEDQDTQFEQGGEPIMGDDPPTIMEPGPEESGELALSPDPPAPDLTEEEIMDLKIQAIMEDPLLGPMFVTTRELAARIDQLEDLVAVQNETIDLIASTPQGGGDLMASFDRFVSTYKLEDQVKGLIRAGEVALLSVAGAEPGMPELGTDFVEDMKRSYREAQERKRRREERLDGLIDRGYEVLILDPEAYDRAVKEGLVEQEEDSES